MSVVRGMAWALAGYVLFLTLGAWGVSLMNPWLFIIAAVVSTTTVVNVVLARVGLGETMAEMAGLVPSYLTFLALGAWGVSLLNPWVVGVMALVALATLAPAVKNLAAWVGLAFFVLLALHVCLGVAMLSFVLQPVVLLVVALVLVVAPWFMRSKPIGQA